MSPIEDFTSGVEVGRYARRAQAEDDALALAAVGIGSRIVHRDDGLALLVAEADFLRAGYELAEYHRENRVRAPSPLRPFREGLNAALAYAGLLLLVQGAAERRLFGFDWWTAGYAQAGLIVSGEWWRTVTALTLHADIAHLGSNMVAGGVFGVVLAQFLGPGLAWFAILIAAGLGNAVNALAHPAAHTAVGASTAVFAAIGLTSILSWRRRDVVPARGMRRWLPVVAGIALLADLGTGGERTDLGAHAFGFVAGVALGAGILAADSRIRQGRHAQIFCGAATVLALAMAWSVALGNP